MLKFNVKPGERLHLDHEVVVQVLAVSSSGSVQLGVEVPDKRRIYRESALRQQIENEIGGGDA